VSMADGVAATITQQMCYVSFFNQSLCNGRMLSSLNRWRLRRVDGRCDLAVVFRKETTGGQD
jgi:hypothetical protein